MSLLFVGHHFLDKETEAEREEKLVLQATQQSEELGFAIKGVGPRCQENQRTLLEYQPSLPTHRCPFLQQGSEFES